MPYYNQCLLGTEKKISRETCSVKRKTIQPHRLVFPALVVPEDGGGIVLKKVLHGDFRSEVQLLLIVYSIFDGKSMIPFVHLLLIHLPHT